MTDQASLNMEDIQALDSVERYKFEPIKGYPMLHWHGKRPFTSTQYYPAQKKEVYGEPVNDWLNKIFWGDNLQVMSHLLKKYRGKVDLIYIDPPFDSKADYKKKIRLKNKEVHNDNSSFEEKQYTDLWSNDEYLQFIYERVIFFNSLMSEKGIVCIHCDYRKSHHIRSIMDEVFGPDAVLNEVAWCYEDIGGRASNFFKRKHDTILIYKKTKNYTFNLTRKKLSESTIKRYEPYFDKNGQITYRSLKLSNPGVFSKLKGVSDLDGVWLDINNGAPLNDWWTDLSPIKNGFNEATGYPTQKPQSLLERIIHSFTNEGDLVFDCFMGSGTTQAAAMKLGRRFIGADINLGAVQTTTKRLIKAAEELQQTELLEDNPKYTGFEVYNVNNYDVFRNPLEAKSLLIEALEIEPTTGTIYGGVKDGYQVKVMPINRIATREDLNELIANFPYKVFDRRKEEAPNKPVESIMLICMGHEPDLKAHLIQESGYKLDVEVVDILRDKANIQFKRDSEAKISISGNQLIVENFYPMNLLQKLSLQKESVSEWRELVESIVIDWNYDGAAMEPTVLDIPEKDEFVTGEYDIPADAGTIKIKITDLLSESYEEVIHHG